MTLFASRSARKYEKGIQKVDTLAIVNKSKSAYIELFSNVI
jgi:hypothetical protein